MILDGKQALPDDQLPVDAPPSYDDLRPTASSSSSSGLYPRGEKSPISPIPPSPSPRSPSSSGPSETGTTVHSRSTRSTSAKSIGSSFWFNFTASKTAKEVHSTVLNLVRDLVKQQPSPPGASGILQSCEEACAAHDVSFSHLLQEKSIEGHIPIYWSIIKRPSEPTNADDPDLVTALLSHSAPLTAATVSEIRHACLLTSDQALFQRLRLSPEFSPLSGTDEMLLGGSIPPDEIEIEDVDNNGGAFVAQLKILAFQKRMRVSRRIDLEFIARGAKYGLHTILQFYSPPLIIWLGRMWQLSFFVAPSSKWSIALSISEHSPVTWIDSRLLVNEPPLRPASSTPTTPSLIDAPNTEPSLPSPPQRSFFGMRQEKPKPTISLRLQTGHGQQLHPRNAGGPRVLREIIVPLDESMMAPSLQYE